MSVCTVLMYSSTERSTDDEAWSEVLLLLKDFRYGHVTEIVNPLLHGIWLISQGEQCRSRSAATSLLSEQDLHCLLFDSLGYF
jgi:hypothetical protein